MADNSWAKCLRESFHPPPDLKHGQSFPLMQCDHCQSGCCVAVDRLETAALGETNMDPEQVRALVSSAILLHSNCAPALT